MAGGFPGDFDPYVHGVNDTMDVDDETGVFSLDVSLSPTFIDTTTEKTTAHDQIL